MNALLDTTQGSSDLKPEDSVLLLLLFFLTIEFFKILSKTVPILFKWARLGQSENAGPIQRSDPSLSPVCSDNLHY